MCSGIATMLFISCSTEGGGFVGTYKKIEKTVATGYKKIEDGVVKGYKKIEDKFLDTFLASDDISDQKEAEKEN